MTKLELLSALAILPRPRGDLKDSKRESVSTLLGRYSKKRCNPLFNFPAFALRARWSRPFVFSQRQGESELLLALLADKIVAGHRPKPPTLM
jgi:hypothetical protein